MQNFLVLLVIILAFVLMAGATVQFSIVDGSISATQWFSQTFLTSPNDGYMYGWPTRIANSQYIKYIRITPEGLLQSCIMNFKTTQFQCSDIH